MSLKKDILDSVNDVIRDVFESDTSPYPENAVPKACERATLNLNHYYVRAVQCTYGTA